MHIYTFVLLTIQYIPHKETEVSGNMHMNTLCSECLSSYTKLCEVINEKLRKENCLSLYSIFYIQRGWNPQNFPKNMHNVFLNI